MKKMLEKSSVQAEENTANQEDIALINRYTKREFTKDELYIFSVVLCDNEVDRDNEYFSLNALENMKKLFVGRTGITDHNPSANNQTARIFSCHIEKDNARKTSYGAEYHQLVAKAYMPINEQTKSVIALIDSGIRKEVSVSCCVDTVRCSICGADIRRSPCEHRKGELYSGTRCSHILESVSDAYEWSFVAVPSQRMAGVVKNYTEVNVNDIIQNLKNGSCKSVDGRNISVLLDYIDSLEKYAVFGKVYHENLKKEYVRYNSMFFENADTDFFYKIAEKYSVDELEKLVEIIRKQAENVSCATPQLFSDLCFDTTDDGRYSI